MALALFVGGGCSAFGAPTPTSGSSLARQNGLGEPLTTITPNPATTPTVATTTTNPTVATTTTVATKTTVATTTTNAYAQPDWLGTVVLPLRSDGFGEVRPTPRELIDRRFQAPDLLLRPVGEQFESTIGPIPDEVLARSSWTAGCPVRVGDLAYVTVSFWGFDGEPHTGELIVSAAHAEGVVGAFANLHAGRFPIEEMRVITVAEADPDTPPTGDSNVTGIFECRPVTGGTGWSMHAYGLAVDVNPFHNPYLKRDLVLPELASAYTDRADHRPGMIEPGDLVTKAFAEIGWSWGGEWRTLKDWMHFSVNGK